MTILIVGILFVIVGTLAYVALRNAQDFSDANEIIPGVATNAPKAWAGAHSPEARLHRRLRDAMTALRANRSLDEPALVEVREALEREALAVDDHLVAAAALPAKVRDEPLRHVTAAVEAIEGVVADIVLLRGPAAGEIDRGLEHVRTRLALVTEARAELAAIDDTSSFDVMRHHMEGPGDDPAAEDPVPEGTEPPSTRPEPPADPG